MKENFNNFIVYWITKLNRIMIYKITICDDYYDNTIAQLEVNGFNKIHRIMLKFEEVNDISGLKTIEEIKRKERPKGKYVIEWGGILE